MTSRATEIECKRNFLEPKYKLNCLWIWFTNNYKTENVEAVSGTFVSHRNFQGKWSANWNFSVTAEFITFKWHCLSHKLEFGESMLSKAAQYVREKTNDKIPEIMILNWPYRYIACVLRKMVWFGLQILQKSTYFKSSFCYYIL